MLDFICQTWYFSTQTDVFGKTPAFFSTQADEI